MNTAKEMDMVAEPATPRTPEEIVDETSNKNY